MKIKAKHTAYESKRMETRNTTYINSNHHGKKERTHITKPNMERSEAHRHAKGTSSRNGNWWLLDG